MRPIGKKRKWPFVLLALVVGSWALNVWIIHQIGNLIVDSMREETGYPTHLRKLSGVLPLGRFHGEGIDFKTRFGPLDSINWTIPDLRLDLRVLPFVSKVYAVQSLDAPGIRWTLDSHTLGGKIEGDLTIRGNSESIPPEIPEDTVWCERVEFSTLAPTGSVNAQNLELPHRTSLEVSPFTLRDGEPILPFEFSFQAQLSSEISGPRIVAHGNQNQEESRFEAKVGAYALDTKTLDRFLLTAAAFDSEMQAIRKQAGDWIQDGSFSLLLNVQSGPTRVEGDVTLRLKSPRFGDKAKEEEFASDQSLRPFLESFERREDTIELGPLAFTEDLTNEEPEAWTQLGALLLADIVSEAPDAAIQTGVGLLRKLFPKKDY